jgi:hypothetical protein
MQSTNQTEWIEINSIKKLTEISNKWKKEEQSLETIQNKRRMLTRAETQVFCICGLKLLTCTE